MRSHARCNPPPLPYRSRRYLVTQAERRFFHALQAAIGERYRIAPKVRLADLIHCSTREWRTGFGGAISQKHVDFVLVSPETLRILLCIELDDRSHERESRRARDAFLNEALLAGGIPLLRIRAASSYEPSQIGAFVAQSIRVAGTLSQQIVLSRMRASEPRRRRASWNQGGGVRARGTTGL